MSSSESPQNDRMSAAEFRVAREYLGLTGDWLASDLAVNPRTVRAWEQGKYPVPDGVAAQVRGMLAETATLVAEVKASLRDNPEPRMTTYASDEDYRRHNPDGAWSAGWHRAATARVAEQIPGLRIEFPAESDRADYEPDNRSRTDLAAAREAATWLLETFEWSGEQYRMLQGALQVDYAPMAAYRVTMAMKNAGRSYTDAEFSDAERRNVVALFAQVVQAAARVRSS